MYECESETNTGISGSSYICSIAQAQSREKVDHECRGRSYTSSMLAVHTRQATRMGGHGDE